MIPSLDLLGAFFSFCSFTLLSQCPHKEQEKKKSVQEGCGLGTQEVLMEVTAGSPQLPECGSFIGHPSSIWHGLRSLDQVPRMRDMCPPTQAMHGFLLLPYLVHSRERALPLSGEVLPSPHLFYRRAGWWRDTPKL